MTTNDAAVPAKASRPVNEASAVAIGAQAVLPQFPPPIGVTSLLSLDTNGSPSNDDSQSAAISSDGKVVAFVSMATDLVANDRNRAKDVFRRDRKTSETSRLPLAGGVAPFGEVSEPTVSRDGSVIAFTYSSPAGSASSESLVMAWDKKTGRTSIVSPRNSTSRQPSISGDGDLIAYSTFTAADRLDTNRREDVVVVNRRTGVLRPVSVGENGATGVGASSSPSISLDGKTVAFQSDAAFDSKDVNRYGDIYVRHLDTATTELVSVGPNGPADGGSSSPAISERGEAVAFLSAAENLAPGDGNGVDDIIWRDLRKQTTRLVSENATHGPANSNSAQPSISADGRIVAFVSAATNLVAEPARNPQPRRSEIYAHDVDTGETILVSEAAIGGSSGAETEGPAVGDQGRVIAFASTSPALVGGDTNNAADVFLREFGAAPVLSPVALDFVVQPTGGKVPPQGITFANNGWGPVRVTGASIKTGASTFELAKNGCANVVLHRDDHCTILVGVVPGGSDVIAGTLRITNDCTTEATTVPLRVITSPILEVDPPVARPGAVVFAVGAGFPSGSTVALSWDRGITGAQEPVPVDASGSFRVQVLVFHNDLVGQRHMTATSVNGTSFEPVSANFLVTDPPAEPPGFSATTLRGNAGRSLITRH